ncbi:DsbA family protein [Streptomyces zaomyceticus]|uniref:DsbA family protein n=1 Tax=Streptomyces zaomyceticus TaxID=68286 RepID=UPI0032552A6C
MPVRRTRRVVAAAVSAGLIGLAAVGCSQEGAPAAAAVTAGAAERADALSGLPAAVDGTKIVVGEAKASHTVTVYVDPRCGHCAKFEASAGTVLAEEAAAGTVKVEYVVASFLDARTGGTASARAANALRASVDAGPGRFAAFQAALFAAQPGEGAGVGVGEGAGASGGAGGSGAAGDFGAAGDSGSPGGFSAEHLLRIADRVEGLRSAAFDRAVRENSHREWVADAEKAFEASGVGGTPTVLVDGTALPGGDALYDAAEFSKVLRDAGL